MKLRCLLFTPGNRPERFAKAMQSGADGVVLDLEDAVPPDEKDRARKAVLEFVDLVGGAVAVRINALSTREGLKDLLALAEREVRPELVLLPKAEEPSEIALIAAHLPGSLMALIESAKGLQNADAIAQAHPKLVALGFGGADLAANLGSEFAFEPLLWGRSRVVQAAALANLAALDVPFLNLGDAEGLESECRRVKALGYTGKFAIHPKQVATIMGAFRPDLQAVAKARRMVEAFEAARGGVVSVDGKMVDLPLYRSAQRILEMED